MGKVSKRVLAMLMAALMLTSTYGCGQDDQSAASSTSTASASTSSTSASTSATKEPITLTMFGGLTNASDLTTGIQNDAVMQELVKRTGVTLDFSSQVGVADANQKLKLLISSNSLPDLVVYSDASVRKSILESKSATQLDDLIKNYPNISKNLEKAIKMSKETRSDSSKQLYILPLNVEWSTINFQKAYESWNIRWDLYKKLNYPKLETLDDYLNVLVEMQKLEPKNADGQKNYGLGLFLGEGWGNDYIDYSIAGAKGIAPISAKTCYLDMESDKIIPRFTDPNSVLYTALEFQNKAYRMGVLDPESAIMKYSNYNDKKNAGRYLAGPAAWLTGSDAYFKKNNTPEKKFLPALINYNKNAFYAAQYQSTGSAYDFIISKNCKNPQRALDLVDYLSTVEGCELMMSGIEGQHYDMVDGKPVVKQEVLDQRKADGTVFRQQSGLWKYQFLMFYTPVMHPGADYPTTFYNSPEVIAKDLSDTEKEFVEYNKLEYPTQQLTNIPKHELDMGVLSSMTMEPGTELADKETKIQAYYESALAKIIFQDTEKGFKDEVAKFQAKIKELGAEEVVKYYQDKYESMKQILK